jgi:membrane-associated protease RseP (regulator of RpoE activity)
MSIPVAGSPAEDAFYAFVQQSRALQRHRYWLHGLLLLLTFVTTSVVGADLAASFAARTPVTFGFQGYVRLWQNPAYILSGLPFSLTLIGILLAHEFGHFFAARYYHVNATLPFFLPAPTLIGTMGAFIRIRSVILSKRILFDIGVAGPLAGFAALLLPLVAGISMSKVVPGVAAAGDLEFGTPLIFRLVEAILFPGASAGDLYLHPVARAAWVGVLATALNLQPIGQLDGGHILYALLGDRAKYLSWIFIAILLPMGYFFAPSWLVWAALLVFFGMRHPRIVDPNPIGRTRIRLAVLAFVILALSFTPAPIR